MQHTVLIANLVNDVGEYCLTKMSWNGIFKIIAFYVNTPLLLRIHTPQEILQRESNRSDCDIHNLSWSQNYNCIACYYLRGSNKSTGRLFSTDFQIARIDLRSGLKIREQISEALIL